MTRSEMLDKAKEIVTKDRQAQHGKPEDSFGKIADYWSAYLGIPLKGYDVANLMILLKIARAQINPTNYDNYTDAAGYAACGCELATDKTNKNGNTNQP